MIQRFLLVFLLILPLLTHAERGKLLSSSLGFTENKGQIIDQNNNQNPGVLYLLNTPGMNVQLRRGGFSYDVYTVTNSKVKSQNSKLQLKTQNGTDPLLSPNGRDSVFNSQFSTFNFHRIDFNLPGSNPNCEIVTAGTSSDYTNYYTTGTPVDGVTSVHSYETVTYKNIYPGIDLQFISSNEIPFKYNFVVHPGGSIDDIKININGPEKVKKIRDGLCFDTELGDVEESIPSCFYLIDGKEIPVDGRFYKIEKHLYGFRVDKSAPEGSILFIDPIPTRRWGTYLGGGSYENPFVNTCKTDNPGNCIIGGYTNSSNNIASSGAHQVVFGGIQDGFLAKFLPDGQRSWCTYYGGSNGDNIQAVAIDNLDNIFIGGSTQSSSNIATTSAYKTILTGGSDAFFAKFTTVGIRLWGTYYGGSSGEWAYGCAADNLGNIYYAGITWSSDGIATAGAVQSTFGGGDNDGFLTKFTGDGGIVWGTYYGGNNNEQDFSCTTDGDNHVFMTGWTRSPNNIATPGSFKPNMNDFEDAFLACFNLNGQRKWGTYFGGSSLESIGGVTANSNDEIYICGTTWSPDNIGTSGTFQPNKLGVGGAFLAKFDTNCQRLWGTYYGSIGENAYGCAVDDSGYVFMVGTATGIDPVIVSPGAYQSVFSGINDGYFVKFDWNGQRIWGTYFGSTGQDEAMTIATDHNDNIYITGWTNSTTQIATPGAFQRSMGGAFDVFLEKFADCYSPDTALQIFGPLSLCQNSTGIVFSIDPIVAATNYQWCVIGDLTITSGQGTTSITVDVGSGLGWDTISVYGINACDTGFPKVIARRVVLRPVPIIYGTDTMCTGAATLYSTAGGKSTYQWTVSPGGAVVSGGGAGDSACTVTWSSGGAQWIRVNYTDTTGCQASSPSQFNVWVIAGPAVSLTVAPSANPVCTGTPVTFTATPVNEGTLPGYQWKVNGINSGTNSPVYTYTPGNGDVVQCILTSNMPCASGNPATSNTVIMIVNPYLPVSVSISTSSNPVCAGTSVTFTATPTNGGTLPSYQWEVNGINFGADIPSYSFIPVNGDIVTCILTSNATCPTGNPATSNPVTMTVNPNLVVSVSISPSSNPFCPGGPVTFTATPVNEGLTPQYQWKVNGINVGINSPTYTYNPANGDQVTCVLNSSIPCPVSNPVTSNMVTMIQDNSLPAGITIAASQNPFCPGSSVTFTATPINGGTNPSWQWKVNGTNAGSNSQIFTYNPIDGDSVRCVMNSNLPCVTNNPVSSLKIIISGTLAPVVTFYVCFDSITTLNAKPIFLKGGIPLGGVYSGPGVNSVTSVFNPALAGIGTKTITYSYTNAALCSASKVKTIIVQASAPFTCGNNLTDIRDNKVYPTVQIGGQCWFANDLNYGIAISSTQSQRDNCLPERYLNSTSFYQWDELMLYNDTQGLQGLCPPGWHVPTEGEWNILFANWAGNGFAGAPLKYSGYSGFYALLTGANHINVQWDYQNFAAFYWSSTPHGTYKAWAHGMNDNNPSVSFYQSLRSNAFSVRCVRN